MSPLPPPKALNLCGGELECLGVGPIIGAEFLCVLDHLISRGAIQMGLELIGQLITRI